MGLSAEQALGAAKTYTYDTVMGAGAIKGQDGKDGKDGVDGVSPVVSTTSIVGGTEVSITDAEGTHTFDVMDGINGTNGQDGKDGKDGKDGTNGTNGTDGVGVPSGGTSGQVLAKKSGTDYDTQWITPSSGGGGIDYSLQEQDTGLKWIDGKKIYQKTFTDTFSETSGQTKVHQTDMTDVDEIVNMYGICEYTIGSSNYRVYKHQLPMVSNDLQALVKVWCGINGNEELIFLSFSTSSICLGQPWYATILYTKKQ